MPTVPFNGFTSDNPFITAQQAQQSFDLRKALAASEIQTSGIDAQSKANIYATQVLSAATATGDQNAYDQAKQHLQQNGIDVSTWAPDVQSGAQQANAARLAQSPLGTLFNAQQKIIGNNIAGTAAMGSTGAAAASGFLQPVLNIMPDGSLNVAPQQSAPVQQAPRPAPSNAPTGNPNMTQPQQNAAITDIYGGGQQPAPAAPGASPAQPVVLKPPVDSGSAAPLPPPPAPPTSVAKFSPPAQQPGETIAAYNQRVQQAFEAYKSDPAYVASQAKATETGKAQADATKSAVGASANYDQVVQTIGGIKALNNSPAGLPQDRYGVPASVNSWANQNFGDQKLADNNNAFTKLNEAQTIGAIKELASTGQIRMTRTLENILNRGYLIEPGSSKASKDQQADLILAELNNSKIAAQNVDAGMNGGQAAPYQQMPVSNGSPSSVPPAGATLYGTSGGKKVYKLPGNGGFVMEQ